MATRLYPCGEYDEEVLAEVPRGTAARLDGFGECPRGYDAEDAWYGRLFADADANKLHSFRLFGWGRLSEAQERYIKRHGLDLGLGPRPSSFHVQNLLHLGGIKPLGRVQNLCWG